MAKNRVSMKEKLNEENKAKESFFKNTEVEAKEDSREEKAVVSETKSTKKAKIETKVQSYYLTPELIKAIALMSVFDEKDKSTIVREALENYIPKEYIEKASRYKCISSGSFFSKIRFIYFPFSISYKCHSDTFYCTQPIHTVTYTHLYMHS